ncbi:DNA-binding SARP family transcriptional activator [Microbacterium terrae]|uniref:Transcriptional regulatory protein MoaR1 n=1 Tax=Microbacterium terrae TaxID=69369 RepID=A0A0M2H5B4_9MICO|nr:BTAD domain-containing putative transcriptional regulator [Microbacterium terrae]KJL38979.1 Transcriptional regulatory protein MoaR1 [Microbacterium terrae]MBP1077080.1 DNA-binding SARP family transcriptional activator [Microbacterium terrae]GLJ99675.1 hypothetical protein GCM10017594_28730 [Microbacterium terrae]
MTIRVLGPMDTGELRLGPRERAVLSALIVRRGTSMTPDEIAEAWWGDTPPATWQQQVRNSVARIRTRLGRDAVETVATDYRLALDGETIDAVRFERLVSEARGHALCAEHDRSVDAYRRALSLWRGTAYPDLGSWEPGLAEAERLASLRADAEEELLDERLHIGEHSVMIPEAERLVRAEPLREDRWAILALANYRTERQAEALAVIRAAKARLADELGIEPGDRLRELETAILRRDSTLDPPVVSAPTSEDCPYPGLRAFGPDDHEFFCGRADEEEALAERVRPGALVVVAGPSGSGKSSLVLAGVVPALRARGRDVTIARPGTGVDRASAAILVIDQAEEAFAADADAGELDRVIAAAIHDGRSVVVTIRSGDLDALRALPLIGDSVGRGVFLLGPMSAESWREAVEEPAHRAGLRVEPGLTELALRDSGDRASTLPHLSHAMRETWRRREGATLTVAGYEAAGGIAGAIALSAERVYRELGPADQAVCRALMQRLLERRPDGMADRREVATAPILGDPARRRVVELLVRERILTVADDTVMVAHEAVAQAWPRLDQWLQEDASRAESLRVIEAGAVAWERGGRSDDDLLRGSRLSALAPWRDGPSSELTPRERAFVEASVAHEEAEVRDLRDRADLERTRNRVLRGALAVAASLAVVALIAGGAALVQGRGAAEAAEDQRIEALTATAMSLPTSDREVSALLAAEVARRWPDDSRGRSALLGAVTASDGLASRIVLPEASMTYARLIPGTRTMLVVEDFALPASGPRPPARVRVMGVDDGSLSPPLAVDLPELPTEYGRNVAISPDGDTAVVQTPRLRDADDSETCCANMLTFIDLKTGAGIGDTLDLDSRTGEFPAFSDDGDTLYLVHTVEADPIAVDVRTGTVTTPTPRDPAAYAGKSGHYNSVAFLDGRVYIGTGTGLAVYDPETLERVETIEVAEEESTSFQLVPDGTGGLLVLGWDSVGRWIPDAPGLGWRREGKDVRCDLAAPVDDATALVCASWTEGAVKLRMADGVVTGEPFPVLSDWLGAVDALPDTNEIVITIARSDPSIQRWRMDGAPSITTPIADGQVPMHGFGMGGTQIITQSIADARDGERATRYRWDIASDAAVSGPGDWYWADDGVIANGTEEGGVTLQDAATGASWSVERAADAEHEFWVHDGGAGPHAFAIGRSTITPIDPTTGAVAGATIGPFDSDLFERGASVSELSDGGRYAVTWWDETRVGMVTVVYDRETGREMASGLEGDVFVVAVPGDELVSASASRLVRSTADLAPVSAFARSSTAPDYMEVSADGRTLLLTTYGKEAALYDLEGGRKLGSDIEVGHVDRPTVPAAFLSPDGESMVTPSETGVLLWDLSPFALRIAACRIAGRELTELEWRTYFGDEPQTPTCADVLP